ncbi:MAG: AmmeMemoRadiSam system protein A [Bacteroidetes bacterium]|nr:AmmeMemoRadiSam system protein A [Bacteroidota bacterium]
MVLTPDEQKQLLELARASIAAAVNDEPLPPAIALTPALQKPSGVFVTLNKDHELRGCIGFIETNRPLVEATQEAAIKAALGDPRFDPVASEELDQISIEISVLAPPEKVTDIQSIEIGKHGLILELGPFRGLLLPQVATEYGWTREEFLEHTARKAGLPPKAWSYPNATLYKFTVQKFSEEDFEK